MGDLEFALVFYHRGRKLRPELQEFRLGIQKAQEAIENSVGKKLENKGELLLFCQGEVKKGPQRRGPRQQNQKSGKGEKTSKRLLGQLHSDKESFWKTKALILQSVGYLDGRVDFWRQQKLMSERERDRKRMQEKWSHQHRSAPGQPGLYVLRSLEVIDA
ncbi:hypothetical protein CRUP_004061, partial [Coryphaenoides rupestris]